MQELINAYQSEDYEALSEIADQILQKYIDNQDNSGLVLFWQNFLKNQLTNDEYAHIAGLVSDMTAFQSEIAHLLKQATERLQSDDNIKAFYYEYFYDGDDESSTGNVFLCLDFSTYDCEWASNFDDLIMGGSIAQYFSDDEIIEIGSMSNIIANYYVYSVLLNAFICEVEKHSLAVPVGFADHDNNYRAVVIMPNTQKIVIRNY